MNCHGRELFHHVIHITVTSASATEISRIRELGGSIKSKYGADDSAANNKFMRLSRADRQNPENLNEASKRVKASWDPASERVQTSWNAASS